MKKKKIQKAEVKYSSLKISAYTLAPYGLTLLLENSNSSQTQKLLQGQSCRVRDTFTAYATQNFKS